MKNLIVWLIAILIAVDPILLAQAQDPVRSGESAQQIPAIVQELSDQMEAAGENDHPQAAKVDSFSFLRQKIRIVQGEKTQTYAIESAPEFAGVGNFDSEVKIDFNASTRTLSLVAESKKTTVYHEFENMDVVAYGRDGEILTVIERNGQVWASDMALAVTQAFRGPLPMVKLLQLPTHLLDGSIRANYLTRGLTPQNIRSDAIVPEDVSKDVFTAGDLVVSNGKEIVAILDRDVMRTQLYTSEMVLSILASVIAPSEQNARILNEIIQNKPNVTETQDYQDLSEVEKEVMRSLKVEKIQELIARATVNQQAVQERRDKFRQEQWKISNKNLRDQAAREIEEQAEAANVFEAAVKKIYQLADKSRPSKVELEKQLASENLSPDWMKLTERQLEAHIKQRLIGGLKTRTLKMIKVILGGGGAALAGKGLINGNGPSWAVHAINTLYEDYWPAVLRDAAYRITLFKSWLMIGSFMPAVYVMGTLAARAFFPSWSAQKVQAKMGMMIYGVVSRPFFLYLARLARQPNFVAAMQKGINPFRKITNENGETYRAGFTNPLLVGQAKQKQILDRRRELDKAAKSEGRTESLAFALAAMTFAETADVDPATLVLLASKNGLSEETVTKINSDKKLQVEWYRIAAELADQLEEFSEMKGQNLDRLPEAQLREAFVLASRVASEIRTVQANSKARTILGDLKRAWNRLGKKTLKASGNFGVQEARFLMKTEPSPYVANQYWRRVFIDYQLTALQMGALGARADLAIPGDLAADPNGPLYTNRGHLTDMVEDLRINNVNIPAEMALVYQREAAIRATEYMPIQEMTLRGEIKSDALMRGLWLWVKGAANLKEAKYKDVYFRELVKGFKTIQAVMLFSIASRVFIGDQTLVVAALATTYVWIWMKWKYNWPWAIINRGNESYEVAIETQRREFMNLKVDLDQALKLDQSRETAESYVRLVEYSRQQKADLPPYLADFESEIRDLLATDPTPAQFEEASRLLRENSAALIDHLLKNPVVPTQGNQKILKLATIIGSVSTTFLASGLFADSFRDYSTMEWFGKIGYVSAMSALIYTGIYVGETWALPAAINKWKILKNRWQGNDNQPRNPIGHSCFGVLN